MCGSAPLYSGKFYDSNVLELVNCNQSSVESYANLVRDAFQRYNEDTQSNTDPFRQQENSKLEPELQDQNSNQDSEEVNCTISVLIIVVISFIMIMRSIRQSEV